MKSIFSKMLCLFILLASYESFADGFNPTPFPLENSQNSECGTWVSLSGNYRLWITSTVDDCDDVQAQLQVTVLNHKVTMAHGLLSLYKNQFSNKYCGSLQAKNNKKIDICIWRSGSKMYSNINKDARWQPFEIFSKGTGY